MRRIVLFVALCCVSNLSFSQAIITVAGNGTSGFTGDGGAATAAEITVPNGVALDNSGNLYFADNQNNRVRKVDMYGSVTTIAGNGTAGYSGDGGAATAAELFSPIGVAVDGYGNVFFSDAMNNRIRKVNSSGIISTVAGTGTSGFSGDGGAATAAKINYPCLLCVDNSGNVYFADNLNHRIRKISTTGTIRTVAGTGSSGYSGDGGAATAAKINAAGVKVDNSGNIYIIDNGNVRIREVNTAGVISTIAGTGSYGYSGDGYAATIQNLDGPIDLAFDGSGNIYITDGNTIKQINSSGIMYQIAGPIGSASGYGGDGSYPSSALLNGPYGIAVDGSGNIFFADAYNYRVREINNSIHLYCPPAFSAPGAACSYGMNISRFEVSGVSGTSISDGSACGGTGYEQDTSLSVALVAGNTYTASINQSSTSYNMDAQAWIDFNNDQVFQSSETVGGINTFSGAATFSIAVPSGIAVGAYRMRVLDAYAYDAGVSAYPSMDPCAAGYSYGDARDYTVNIICPAPIVAPISGSSTACIGASISLVDDSTGGTWSSSDNTIATVDGSGNVYGVSSGTSTISYSLTNSCGTASAVTVVTVTAVPSAGTLSGTTTFCPGQISTLTASGSAGGTWTSTSTSVATVDGSGDVYGVAAGSTTISYTITNSCGTATATASVTINPAAAPGSLSGTTALCPGQVSTLTASGSTGGTWSSTNTSVASVDGSGDVYGVSAGTTTISYTITTTCGTVAATAAVTINPAPSAGTISGSGTLCTGATTTLTDAASGGTWSSGSTTIATISSAGAVTGVSSGTSAITYTVINSCGTATATTSITVHPAPSAGHISGATSITTGATISLSDTTSGGTWTSTNTSVATVSGTGTVTGVALGSTTISYSVTNSCGTAVATLAMTVSPAVPASCGVITILAGTGTPGYSGDGGSAVAAELYVPFGVAVDGSGNLYIADPYDYVIRKVTFAGTISTIAGTGSSGYSGDGGAATAAKMNLPQGVAVDAAGNVYVADFNNNCIRKINTSGIISTIAGNGSAGYAGDGGPATAAQLYRPSSVAVDASGNLFVADANNQCIRKITSSGTITTVAGTGGTSGYSGDGGAATAAQLWQPVGVAVDGSGNIYIADENNYRIRMVNASGIISTIAGNGTSGYSGDGGAATAAELYYPVAVAADGAGNVYFSDYENQRIRKIATTGIITTFAGNGSYSFGSDVTGDVATATPIYFPQGLAVDGSGNLFFGDNTSRVAMIGTCSTGCVAPVVGALSGASSVCTGAAITLTDTTAGGTWVSSDTTLATVSNSGIVTGISAGTVIISYTAASACRATTTVTRSVTVNPSPYAAAISGALSMTVGSSVTLSDSVSGGTWSSSYTPVATITTAGVVRGMSAGTTVVSYTVTNTCGTYAATATLSVLYCGGSGIITTIAGNGTAGYSGDGGAATAAELNGAYGIAADAVGNVYIAEYNNNRVRKVTTSGVITTIAGTGTAGYSGDGGAATAAKLNNPWSLGVDRMGNVYIADYHNNRIRKVNTSGIISTIAGTGTAGYSGDGGAATAAALYGPTSVFVDSALNIIIADADNYCVRKMNASGIISTIAGVGGSSSFGYSGDGGAATAARLGGPYNAVADAAGNVYIADFGNNVVRKVNTSGVISTYAGSGSYGFTGDGGPATAAGFNRPYSVALDLSGNLYIADNGSNHVRKVNTSGIISTVVGTGVNAFGGDGGPATAARIFGPACVATDSLGNLYVDDAGNNRVRKVTPAGTTTTVASITGTSVICGSGSITLSDSTTGGSWSSSRTYVATVSSAGVVTGTGADTATIFYTYTNACGTAVASKSVTVYAMPNAGTISGAASLCAGSTTTLADAVSGGTWSSSNTTIATVSATGVVTGVSSGVATITYTVTTICGSATTTQSITVNPYAGIISGSANICRTASTALSSTVSGGTWSSTSNSIATVSSAGIVYGVAAGVDTIKYTVTGTCGTNVARFVVTVSPNTLAAISGGTTAICPGATATLTDATSGGTWSSNNTAEATVGSTGVVTAISSGIDTIVYSITNACGSYSVLKAITITSPTIPAAIGGYSTPLCPGGTTETLNDATTGGVWSSSNTAIATVSSTGVVTGVAAGIDSIKYSFTNSCGLVGTSVKVVTVTSGSPAVVTGPSSVCLSDTITLSAATGGGVWTGTNYIATVSVSTGQVIGRAAGSVVVRYSFTNTCGTYATNDTVTVIAPGVAAVSGGSTVCQGATIALTDATLHGGWSSSSTSLATISSTGLVTGVSAGVDSVYYTVVNACGTNVAAKAITISPLPYAGAITGASSICVGSTATLTNSATGGVWSSSAASVATVNSAGVVRGLTAGIATISYTVTNSCGTVFATYAVSVISPAVAAISGSSTICQGASATFTDATAGGSWGSSNASLATVSLSGIVTATAAGTDTIVYSVTNVCGTNSVIKSISITGPTYPAAIAGYSSSLCPGGSTATLTDATSGGVWSSSNNAVATVSSAGVVTGVAPGADTIRYSITNGCGLVGSSLKVITVTSGAPAVVAGPSSVCLSDTITLSAVPSGGTWSGTNYVATVASSTGQVIGRATGSVVVRYSFTNTCGTYSTNDTITVVAPGVAAVSGSSSVCPGAGITLTDATSGGSWSSRNTSLATVTSSGIVTGVAAGVDSVYYTLVNACGTSSVVKPVTIAPLPYAGTIAGPSSICVGTSSSFTDSVTGGMWSSSALGVATVNSSGVVTGVTAGTATITYTFTNSCGTVSATHAVSVASPLVAGISGTGTICQGATAAFVDGTTGGSWISSNTSLATVSSSGVVTGVGAGTDTIIYSVSNACGTNSVIRPVTITGPSYPAPIAGYTNSLCTGGSTATLTDATSRGAWSSANTAIVTVSATGVITGVAIGVDTIRYSITNSCGLVGSAIQVVSVTPNDTAVISGPATVCTSGSITLTASIIGGAWAGTTSKSNVNSSTGVITGLSAGIAVAYYTFINTCGTHHSSYVYSVIAPGVSAISGSATVCAGATVTLTDATVGSATWTSANTGIATISATGVVTGVSAGVDSITYNVTNGCGTYSISKAITVNPLPNAGTISGNSSVIIAHADTLTVSGVVGTGVWSSVSPSIATIAATGILHAVAVGTDTVKYTATNSCGTAVARKVITVTASRSEVEQGANVLDNNNGIINIFPNPASSILNIEWNGALKGKAAILVTDLLGKEIYKTDWDLSATNGKGNIDVSTFATGMYIIRIKSAAIDYSGKIIVQM